MFIDREAVERQKRMAALDLANCSALQDPVDYLQGQVDGLGEEDTVIDESSVPSAGSGGRNDSAEVVAAASTYSDGQGDSVGPVAGPSTGKGTACAMSMPMPMGLWQDNKHATPVVNLGTHHGNDGDGWCTSCMGGLLECWNRFWWVWGCSWFMCGKSW